MPRKRMKVYRVPVTILDERVVTVRAHSEEHARERLEDGKYVSLGQSTKRGFLTVGVPEQVA